LRLASDELRIKETRTAFRAAFARLDVLPTESYRIEALIGGLVEIARKVTPLISGKPPAAFYTVDDSKVAKDLDEISKRSRELAVAIAIGAGHVSKRHTLKHLLQNIHAPTIDAIARASYRKIGVHYITLNLGHLRADFPRLLGSDEDLKPHVPALEFISVVAGEQARKIRKALPPRSRRSRVGTYGAIADMRADGVTNFVRHAYWLLTGKRPTAANQEFSTFAMSVFQAIGLPVSDYRLTKR
jgi:hypothetical protein